MGASLSEPHTSESNGGFFIYIYILLLYICRTYSVNACSTLLTRTLRTPIRAGRISKRTRGHRIKTVLELCGTQSRRVLLLSSNPEFYLQRFRLQVVFKTWMPTATLEELSNQRRSKKIGDGAETKETQVEEMLISGVLPIMSLYRLPHGQYGYSGHVINLPQDVGSFANTLP